MQFGDDAGAVIGAIHEMRQREMIETVERKPESGFNGFGCDRVQRQLGFVNVVAGMRGSGSRCAGCGWDCLLVLPKVARPVVSEQNGLTGLQIVGVEHDADALSSDLRLVVEGIRELSERLRLRVGT
jgi:hypothetical protein